MSETDKPMEDLQKKAENEKLYNDSFPENPFVAPIKKISGQIFDIEFVFPWIHSLISMAVHIVILLILSIFYPTVGILIQIEKFFQDRILETYREMKKKSDSTEQIGDIVIISTYALVFVPSFILISPFMMFYGIVKWFISIFLDN